MAAVRLLFTCVVLAFLLLNGCDARSSASTPWRTATSLAPEVRAGSSGSFTLAPDGSAVSTSWSRPTKSQGLSFGVRVPVSADGSIDVGLATTDEARAHDRAADFVLRVTHPGWNGAPRRDEDGAATYASVTTSTDLVVTAGAAHAEWFYVLRDAAAPSTVAMHVELPRGLARAGMRADGSLAFFDARSQARLVMRAPFVVDGHGVRRDVKLAWDADANRATVTIDPRGLAYPLLVDPAVEHPVWQEVAGQTTITNRSNAGMVYDAARGRTVLFGGLGTALLADTWEWDGTSWTQIPTANAPSARSNPAMAYDAAHGVTVLFGGSGATTLSDTWTWDGTTWTQLSLVSSPPPRYEAAITYDSARRRVVLFGGSSSGEGFNGSQLDDTWEWDGTTWTLASPAISPPGRVRGSMAYDSARGTSFLYGGNAVPNTGFLTDVWEWDGTTWTEDAATTTGPRFPESYPMAYDVARDKLLLFAGSGYGFTDGLWWEWGGTNWNELSGPPLPDDGSGGSIVYDTARSKCVLFLTYITPETWEWDGTTWSERFGAASGPAARWGAGMVFDAARGKTTLFGGSLSFYSTAGDTWDWDGTTWTKLTTTNAPPAAGISMVYDGARAKTILFGGTDYLDGGGDYQDTWQWDGSTWTKLTVASPPPARTYPALTYDGKRQRVVMFGGNSASGGYQAPLSDTWEWDGTKWTQITPLTSPPARSAAGAAYDAARSVTVVFGGEGSGGSLADTWTWDGTSWTQPITTVAPSAREGAAMTYDSRRARTVLFGGSVNNENEKDTWEWDGTVWESAAASNPSARSSAAMAFDALHGTAVMFGGTPQYDYGLADTWLYETVGAACTTTSTCDTGFCSSDGVCCNAATCGTCQSCSVPGHEGTCANVATGTVPLTSAPNACAAPSQCTADGVCGAPLGASCATAADCYSAFCVDGVCCDSACTGNCQACSTSRGLARDGNCAFAAAGIPGRTACANSFACNGKGVDCPTACTDDSSCAAGTYCNSEGACVPQLADGAKCDDNAGTGADCLVAGCRDCAHGHCVDNLCCANCQGTVDLGNTCTNDAQCISNHCVGGSCCNDTCPPPSSDAGASATCGGVCLAANGYKCSYPAGTECRAQACVNGLQTFIAVCDGQGGCGALQTKTCVPYTCSADACTTSCASNTDCDSTATCDVATSTCVTIATCSADGTAVVANDGVMTSCAPYVCAGGKCETSCTSIADCTPGDTCNANGACVAPPATTTLPGSGCSCRLARTSTTPAAPVFAFAAAVLAFARRSRKRGGRAASALFVLVLALTMTACRARPQETTAGQAMMALASKDVELSSRMRAAVPNRFVAEARGGAISSSWSRATKAQGLTFGARVPASADGTLEVGFASTREARDGGGDYVLRVTHPGWIGAPRTDEEGSATYASVAPSTDFVVTSSEARAEWFYLLRDAAAPSRIVMQLSLPRGLARAEKQRDGSLAFMDARNHARLSMPEPFAIDANGRRVEVSFRWDPKSAHVELAIDPRGLTYPILVDPAVEHPIWEEVSGSVAPQAQAYSSISPMAYDIAHDETVLLVAGTSATWVWNGTVWTQRAVANAPSPRTGAVMAYDVVRARVVMFGGLQAGTTNSYVALNDTWEWDGTTWTLVSTISAPGPRSGAAMAYDQGRGKMVLFGGNSNTNSDNEGLSDTWEWDGTSWTAPTTTQSPPARANATLAYDGRRAKTVLVGGDTFYPATLPNDTWEWDGTIWTDHAIGSTPPSTDEPIVYDPTLRQSILYTGDATSDTWGWNGTVWTLLSSSPLGPLARTFSSAVFDTKRSVVLMFGGLNSTCGTCGDVFYDDTWEWSGSWTQVNASLAPSPRNFPAMAYDEARAVTVVFSGYDNQNNLLNDTWEWNGSLWAERSASGPGGRDFPALFYDETLSKTVLFAGSPLAGNYTGQAYTAATFYDDMWTWDGTTWRTLTAATKPSARSAAAIAYDSTRHRAILFGGWTGTTILNDTWQWDGTNWTLLNPVSAPSARGGSAMTYDSGRDRVVLFGGTTGYLYQDVGTDTWEWDGTNWAEIPTAVAPFQNGDFDSGFLAYDRVRGRSVLYQGSASTWEWDGATWRVVSTVSPPSRVGGNVAYDAARREVVMFGGSTGAISDTWVYLTEGSACTTEATCDTGACVDGVCCNAAACGSCQACNLAGSEGTCANVPAGTVPTTGDPNACASPFQCTALGTCGAPDGSSCATSGDCYSGFCVDGACCDSACDGACQACSTSRGLAENGTCSFAPNGTSGRTACAALLLCDGKGADCPTACTDDSSCAAGNYCDATGACVAQKAEGQSCDDSAGKDCLTSGCNECVSGHCVDGACCSSCQGSAALGVTCTNDAQCASNHCIGGSCCADSCPAPTSGAEMSALCSAPVCPATNGYKCTYPSGIECRAPSCTNETQTFVAVCDGKGGCGALQTTKCSPYTCNAASLACFDACTSDADCDTAVATCSLTTNKCVTGSSCSADGTSVVPIGAAPMSCAPYVCVGGKCVTTCSSIDDCASGSTCNAAGVCVPTDTAVTMPGSGCSCRVYERARGARSAIALSLAAIALVVARRRRRRYESRRARVV